MARLNKHSLLASISGALGKEIVIKQYADKVVVSKFPDMTKAKASARQRVQRDLLAEAVAYASHINRDPLLRKKYKKKVKKNGSVYHYAIKEFFSKRKKL